MDLIFWLLSVVIVIVNGQSDPNCQGGKNVVVQFFGWKWTDIANECDSPLNQFMCAVQVPPPFEHEKITLADGSDPWYQRWSIVGYYYRITDSGDNTNFDLMVHTCNINGISVYIDMEVNHMTPDGNIGPCFGSAGSYYDGRDDASYAIPSYPSVPWNRPDFHLAGDATNGCPTSSGNIEDVTDPEQLWKCKLNHNRDSYDVDGHYNDLRTDTVNYRREIVERMNALVDIGVSGFKFSHARWVRPAHLKSLSDEVKDVPDTGDKPFIYSETVDFKDGIIYAENYTGFGRVEEVMAGHYLSEMARRDRPLTDFEYWGDSSSGVFDMVNSANAIVYIDDPNRQRNIFVNSSGYSFPVVTFRDQREYIVANSLMLSHPYGMKKVFSSYNWEQNIADGEDLNDWQGPPMTDGTVDDVNPTDDGFSCEGAWNCEHRWQAIRGMMFFENTIRERIAEDPDVDDGIDNFQSDTNYQIAFTRGTDPVGFFVVNGDDEDLSFSFQTGLPQGTYCDLTTKLDFTDLTQCSDSSERTVEVEADGTALINIESDDPYPAIAILA